MTRVLSALVLLPVVLAILVGLPAWGTLALALAALVIGVWELAGLAEHGSGPLPKGLMTLIAALALLAVATPWVPLPLVCFAALIVTGCVLVAEARPDGDVVRKAAVMLFPALYLGVPFGAMVMIRRTDGPWMLMALLATTIVSDTAQYYGGRRFGRRPLAPRVSPKKTVEGALVGLAVGALVLPMAGASLLPSVSWWLLWLVGLALVGLGIVGDLFESLLKRSVGVKDSSNLIPGHGGLLDRVDALLFAAPFFAGVLAALR